MTGLVNIGEAVRAVDVEAATYSKINRISKHREAVRAIDVEAATYSKINRISKHIKEAVRADVEVAIEGHNSLTIPQARLPSKRENKPTSE